MNNAIIKCYWYSFNGSCSGSGLNYDPVCCCKCTKLKQCLENKTKCDQLPCTVVKDLSNIDLLLLLKNKEIIIQGFK